MSTVFDVFVNSPYTFLELKRGGVYGNTIENSYDAIGVFKLRTGMVTSNNQETRDSDATLHIKPDESFLAVGSLVGHGIRAEGREFEIIGETGGRNFDNGELEHYRVTLKITDLSEFGES